MKSNDICQELLARDLLRKQTEKAEVELRKLKEANKGRVGNVLKLVQAIHGPKKGGSMEAHAVMDPVSGDLAVSSKEIKGISLDYYKIVLTNNEVEEEVAEEIPLKENEGYLSWCLCSK